MNAGDKVSVVIPTRGLSDMLANCLRSLAAFWPSLEVIVVEHDTHDAKELLEETFPNGIYVQALDEDAPKRGEGKPAGHSYSTLNNLGVAKATRPYVLLMNNDVTARKGALDAMVEVLDSKADVGIVGAKLLTPKNKIQHIGVVFDHFGVPGHLAYGQEHERTYLPAWRSEYYDAVTFAAAMVRKDLWDEIGGLDDVYFFNYEDIDFCLKAAQKKKRCYVTQVAIFTHLEGGSAEHRRTGHHSIVRNLTIFRDRWIETGLIEDITGLKLRTGQGPLAMENMNLMMMPSGRGAGVSWWRMDLIGQKIAKKKLANVMFAYSSDPREVLMEGFSRADVVIIQGHHGGDLIKALRDPGRPFKAVFDHDDHPVHLSPYAEVYRSLGTQEIQLAGNDGSEVWLWRDGQSGFDLAKNRTQKASLLETMAACDAMTTTTVPLADYFRSINPRVFVLPNCIDFDFYPPVYDRFRRAPDDGVRIGWWGGDNHWHDMVEMGPWTKDYVNGSDTAKLVLIGAFYKGPFRGIDMSKVEDQTWVHVEAWPYKLATAGLDIAVIPLANPAQPFMAFNHFKSDIKWLEAAAYKIPCLVQAGVAPYESCLDGVNALTFASKDEYLEKLDRLAKDPLLRKRLGQAAYDYAREHRNLDKNIDLWMEAYHQLAKGQPEDSAAAPEAKVP